MNYILNKKLLEIILDKSIHSFSYCKEFKEMTNFISITFKDGTTTAINIYELAHKCKILAFYRGYSIESYYEDTHGYEKIPYAIVKVFFDGSEVWNNYSKEYINIWHTEPEAIFKATEYIYNIFKE